MAAPRLTDVLELARDWLADDDAVEDFDSDLYAAHLEDAYLILKALVSSR